LAVYLEAARLQFEQADNGGIAGAEIVDFDVDAELLDLLDVPCDQIIVVVEEDRLDKFEGKSSLLDVEVPQTLQQFLVLKAPEIPSVLLELGYLSNKDDEKLFKSETWAASEAEKVARAIEAFFGGKVTTGEAGQ